MKITCERCSAQYDLDENRIPPSGMTMKCPACLHQFTVRRGGSTSAAPPPPPSALASPPPKKKKEIEISSFGDDEGPTPLPDAAPGMIAPDPDEIDLPAPKDHHAPDLPAPKSASRGVNIPPPKPPAPPAMPPVKKPPPVPIEPEQTRDDASMSITREMGPGPDEIDLPAPVDTKARDIVDLPAPRSGSHQARPVELSEEDTDLLAPKDRPPQVGISLDAPDPDDMPSTGSLGDYDSGHQALELDNIDVVAPKVDTPELPAPRHETMDVAPRAETTDVAPRFETTDVASKGPVPPPPVPPGGAPLTAVAKAKQKKDAKDAKDAQDAEAIEAAKPPRRRWGRMLAAVAGLLLLLGGVGVALGVFTGVGRDLLHGKGNADLEQKLMSARKQMADDTPSSYRAAALGLGALLEGDSPSSEAAALAAQARLGLARLGMNSELKNADALLTKLASDEKAQEMPDLQKAKALRSTVGGNWADARTKLNIVLGKAPADAAALVYLGWTELGAGDAAAADKAFAKALASEATRAAALYGDGLAKEQLGDATAAHDLYARALARSPNHFGAAVGEARTAAGAKTGNEAQAKVADLIEKRSAVAAPRELSDAWATVGLLAAREGRRDEAEDRLKRALGLDANNVPARVALARVQCDLKKCADAVAPLKKLLAAQPKNLDARLALARAELESGNLEDANTTLAPAIKDAPKNPEVLYLSGRMIMAVPRVDKEPALAKFKEAIAADPKFIPAYVAASNTLGVLDRSDEALAILQQAQQQAADSPELMTQLGEAYLALGKPVDAEARFRAVLEKKPEIRAARIDLGAALEAQNKLEEARAQYDQVATEDPKFPGVLERQARLAARQNRKADAAKLFDEALTQGVPTQSLRLAAGALYLDPTIARLEDARKLAESVIKDDDRSAQAHLLMARTQIEAGHPEEALPEARRAATLADLPEAHLMLGRVLEATNKLDQAIAEYNLGRRPPVEGEAQLGRARILVRMGATKDALSELAALAKDPKLRAQALLLTGDCYADLQQTDRARHSYEDAVRASPDSGDAAFKLGRAYHDAGRRHDAIAQLDKAIKLGGDKIRWAAEAQLLLGDAHREGRENEAAIKAYKRYLELAPADAPARAEVQKHITILGGG